MIKSSQQMVEEALLEVRTVSVEQAMALNGQPHVLMVDLREPGERQRNGGIAGAFPAPRGLIEFWFDPTPDVGKPELTRPHMTYLLFCAAGWRSALAAKTLQDMGVADVCHLEGGFQAWQQAGGPVKLSNPSS